MHKKISIEDFCCDVLTSSEYVVNVNNLIGVCGASPIRVHYKTDKVVVSATYPESIVLQSGENYISLSQVQAIYRIKHYDGKLSYKIECGRLNEFKITVEIVQI